MEITKITRNRNRKYTIAFIISIRFCPIAPRLFEFNQCVLKVTTIAKLLNRKSHVISTPVNIKKEIHKHANIHIHKALPRIHVHLNRRHQDDTSRPAALRPWLRQATSAQPISDNINKHWYDPITLEVFPVSWRMFSFMLQAIISSHHMEKTEAGLKGLCIREIMTEYTLYYTKYYTIILRFPMPWRSGCTRYSDTCCACCAF